MNKRQSKTKKAVGGTKEWARQNKNCCHGCSHICVYCYARWNATRSQPKTKVNVGKLSYPNDQRIDVFNFAISEIRQYFDSPIALCKETIVMWKAVGLDPHRCKCVCQYSTADIVHQSPMTIKTTRFCPGTTG